MSDKILGFRDPYTALRDIILAQGYDEQLDQPILDAVDTLERDLALLVWDTIQEKLDVVGKLDLDELSEFVLNQQKLLQEKATQLTYLH